jgi:hypothetical protein
VDAYARLKLFAAIVAKNLHFLTVGQMIATAADHTTHQGKCWHIAANGAKKLANISLNCNHINQGKNQHDKPHYH